jgi:hypothetical protein
MNTRANVLADRIEQGARNLAAFAEGLTDADWRAPVHPDGRAVGVIVHHVASVYPLEVQLAQTLAEGKPISGVTWDAVATMNAEHAHDHGAATKSDTLDLLRRNSKAAADAIRRMTDEQLDRAANVSLYADAPLTAQFFIEDHALRHSYHHLGKIRKALGR